MNRGAQWRRRDPDLRALHDPQSLHVAEAIERRRRAVDATDRGDQPASAPLASAQLRLYPLAIMLLGVHLRCLLFALVVADLAAQQPTAAPAATDTFDARLQRIVPGADELAFLAVPWGTELRAALVLGDTRDQPILLWAMNGHPLGQT